MKLRFCGILAILAFSLALSCAGSPKNTWSEREEPVPGRPESIGKHTAGCLKGAETLHADGPGFQVMRLARGRFWGHPELVDFIQKLGRRSREQRLGTLLIGDMAYPQGGPFSTDHSSHQSGLDVDIWFYQDPKAENSSLSLKEREVMQNPSMIKPDGSEPDPGLWKLQNSKILKLASQDERVERIFVHHSIKKLLCNQFPKEGWMSKIRPWYRHEDHFHVRLRCPAESPLCIQPNLALQEGNGCDETLDWWTSAEAKKEAKINLTNKLKPELPELPPECRSLVAKP